MLIQQPYRFNAQLSVNQAEQKIIDDALKTGLLNLNQAVRC